MRGARGFTLLEVVVCLAVVSIMLGLALPQIRTLWDSAAEKEAARNVLAALRLARSQAITHNLEYQVAFDLDSRSFWLERGNLSKDSTEWNFVKELGAFSSGLGMATKKECNHTVGDGDFTTADNSIQFNPNGTCGSSGSANSRYICVQDETGGTAYRTGVPSSITGRAIIIDY
ncbi:prepilin-type N-terminal cleavage/methylation domain-containing protein [Malonomonas rubra DSM 5091]|uniref:Type II secretion system protein H n=1 Tax=Malonomonas rubra DSM 5091 TaxID=1122189 RepID=A0A1M6BL08_MALRU|nr:GspH/FimT family pseudopilin [Malonomonas rubra]SHI49394.1 prepilin-type N-terminal cleavage/methylation domain-containing protein [Malonomonas rubra DSM 5091]